MVLIVLASVSAILCALALGACERGAQRGDSSRLTILYTGGVQGALEPCGCSPGQLGGLARAATLVKRVRGEGGDVILVDAGDLLFREDRLEGVMRDQLILKARFVAKAYGALRAAKLNIGEKDLAAGLALPLEEARNIHASPISTNLLHRQRNPSEIVRASVVQHEDGPRVAFLGVANPSTLPPAVKETIRAEDPRAAVERELEVVKAMSPKVDMVVLLSTLGLDADRRLLEALPGIDLVIDAGVSGEPRNVVIPMRAGNGYIVRVKPLGEFMGRVDIALGPRGKPLRDATASDRIEGMPAEGAAGAPFSGDGLDLRGIPERPKRRGETLPPPAPGTLRHRVYALGDTLAQDAGIQQLLKEYKEKVAELNRAAPVSTARLPTEGASYVGEETCRSCHTAIHAFVQTIGHAHAYATLEKKNSELDRECVGCHVTGWRKPGGFDDPRAAGNLKNVQCEVCHGPGSLHVVRGGRGVGGMRAEVPLTVCRECHTPEQSTRFAGHEAEYLEAIRCTKALTAGGGAPRSGPGAGARPSGRPL
jgi:hypothetical protein